MDKKLKILIVEDEFLIALSIEKQLEKLGYDLCKPVASGGDAIQVAIKENPDVILIDVNLAGPINGLQVHNEISAQCSAVFIFMTGYMNEELMKDIRTLSPLACLTKPILIRDVQAAISRWQQIEETQ